MMEAPLCRIPSPVGLRARAALPTFELTERNAGLLTSGESEAVRFVGPIAPATQRGRSVNCDAARLATTPSTEASATELPLSARNRAA